MLGSLDSLEIVTLLGLNLLLIVIIHIVSTGGNLCRLVSLLLRSRSLSDCGVVDLTLGLRDLLLALGDGLLIFIELFLSCLLLGYLLALLLADSRLFLLHLLLNLCHHGSLEQLLIVLLLDLGLGLHGFFVLVAALLLGLLLGGSLLLHTLLFGVDLLLHLTLELLLSSREGFRGGCVGLGLSGVLGVGDLLLELLINLLLGVLKGLLVGSLHLFHLSLLFSHELLNFLLTLTLASLLLLGLLELALGLGQALLQLLEALLLLGQISLQAVTRLVLLHKHLVHLVLVSLDLLELFLGLLELVLLLFQGILALLLGLLGLANLLVLLAQSSQRVRDVLLLLIDLLGLILRLRLELRLLVNDAHELSELGLAVLLGLVKALRDGRLLLGLDLHAFLGLLELLLLHVSLVL